MRQKLTLYLDKKRFGPRVRERVLRLNPDPKEGEILRGFRHADTTKRMWWDYRAMGKGEYLRWFGREAWEALPNARKIKRGRRKYVLSAAVKDHEHLAYLGKAAAGCQIPIYADKRYSNDPRGVEILGWRKQGEL